jgi:signal transduction histidine kinase
MKLRRTLEVRTTRPHRGEPHDVTVASTNTGITLVDTRAAGCHNHGVPGVPASWAKLARLAAAPIGLAVAVGALLIAAGPGMFTTYAGRSGLAAGLMVAAGLALVLAGLLASQASRTGRAGDLAVLAGLVWFAPVWVGWELGPPLVRSLGMIAAGFAFPLIFYLVLAFPGRRPLGAGTRALAWAVYLEVALAALGLALFRDPYIDPTCWANCTDNVFLVRSLPALARAVTATDRWFSVVAATMLLAVYAWRLLARRGRARVVLVPIALPAIVFAAATGAHAIALSLMPLEDPANPAFQLIFDVQSAAVILLAAGLAGDTVMTMVHRRSVARIVASLGETPAPGSLESALARALGDPELRVAYWLPDVRRYVDAQGRPVAEPAAAPGRPVTVLMRQDRRVAMVSHAAALPELEREFGAAVRLGLENERLQAEILFQLGEVRASRARIVQAGDAERRQLERNLHDGAQQRILALSYDIRLAHASAEADADDRTRLLLEHALADVQAGLGELRELAYGIYPAILTEAGLGPALATLAESASIPVELDDAVQGRYPEVIETAAYLMVAEAIEDAAGRGAGYAAVTAAHRDGRLTVTVEDDGQARSASLTEIADRVGALGGILTVEPTRLGVDIPCG